MRPARSLCTRESRSTTKAPLDIPVVLAVMAEAVAALAAVVAEVEAAVEVVEEAVVEAVEVVEVELLLRRSVSNHPTRSGAAVQADTLVASGPAAAD